MKYFKLYEEYFDEKKLVSGQYLAFVGSVKNVKSFMNSLTEEALQYVQKMSDTQVRVSVNVKRDLESSFEIHDLLSIFDLVQIDLNSVQ